MENVTIKRGWYYVTLKLNKESNLCSVYLKEGNFIGTVECPADVKHLFYVADDVPYQCYIDDVGKIHLVKHIKDGDKYEN